MPKNNIYLPLIIAMSLHFSANASACPNQDYYCQFARNVQELLITPLSSEHNDELQERIRANYQALDHPDMQAFYNEPQREHYKNQLQGLLSMSQLKADFIECGASREAAFMEGILIGCREQLNQQQDVFNLPDTFNELAQNMDAISDHAQEQAIDEMVQTTGRNVFTSAYNELAKHYLRTGQGDKLTELLSDQNLENYQQESQPCIARRERRGATCQRRGGAKLSMRELRELRDSTKEQLLNSINSGQAPPWAQARAGEISFTQSTTEIMRDHHQRLNTKIDELNQRLGQMRGNLYAESGMGFISSDNSVVVEEDSRQIYHEVRQEYSELMNEMGSFAFDRSLFRSIDNFPELCDGYNGPDSECVGQWVGTESDRDNPSMSSFAVEYRGQIRSIPWRCLVNCGLAGAANRVTSSMEEEVNNGISMLKNDSNEAQEDAVSYNPSMYASTALQMGNLSANHKQILCQAGQEHQQNLDDEDARRRFRQRFALACGLASIPVSIASLPVGASMGLACSGVSAIGATADAISTKNDLERLRSSLVAGTGFSGTHQELLEREREFNGILMELTLEVGMSTFDVV